jgi:hypothetical protein
MLSDSDLIDGVNPYADYPPGTWSAPYSFDAFASLKEEYEGLQEPSPACNIQVTAGDKQIDWCEPGVPNCPMSRELEPTQKVDTDISYADRGDIIFGSDLGITTSLSDILSGDEPYTVRYFGPQFFMNLVVLLIAIIVLVKLTGKL